MNLFIYYALLIFDVYLRTQILVTITITIIWLNNLPPHGSSWHDISPLLGSQIVFPSQPYIQSIGPESGVSHWDQPPHTDEDHIQSHT